MTSIHNPKISIIVPNYNHSKHLNQRLESVFNQTFQDFEVILLDDCSNDNSVEILQDYAQYQKVSHFIKNEKNSGSPFKQWNKGLNLSNNICVNQIKIKRNRKIIQYMSYFYNDSEPRFVTLINKLKGFLKIIFS